MKIKPISLISVLLFFGGLTLLGISLELLWLAIIFEVCALLAIVPHYFKQKSSIALTVKQSMILIMTYHTRKFQVILKIDRQSQTREESKSICSFSVN